MARPLTIGRLARATGVSARTIRYYERIGVLPAPGRTPAGYRQYSDAAVQRLLFVRRARALGLSIRSLKTLVTALDGGPRAAVRPRVRALVQGQLSSVQQQLADLQLLEAQLQMVLRRTLKPPWPGRANGCGCLDVPQLAPPPRRRR